MAEDKTVEGYFDKQEPPIRNLALGLRDRVEALGPKLTCKLAWGFPCWSGNERVFSIIAHSDRCNLQLWYGAALAEQFDRIEGTGKALRHVKVRSLSELNDGLDAIIKAAIHMDTSDPQRVA